MNRKKNSQPVLYKSGGVNGLQVPPMNTRISCGLCLSMALEVSLIRQKKWMEVSGISVDT